jgi:ribosomal protein S18 acetylase RimI-like enzyme
VVSAVTSSSALKWKLMSTRTGWFRYLEILAVHPDHQKQSIGSRLLDLHLASMQPDHLAWLESSPAGKRLYDSRGFEDVGEVVAEGWAEGFPAMRRNPQ